MKILLLVILSVPFTVRSQNNADPLRNKALLLKTFFDRKHYKPVEWNDSTSVLFYNRWMEELDNEKLLFTQKDITVTEAYRTKLDDEMNGKGWDFFSLTTKLFRSRIKRADSIIQSFLERPVDFSKPDSIRWPYETYAANEQELVKRWQRYLKWRILDNIYDKLSGEDNDLPETVPVNFIQLEVDERQRTGKQETNYIRSLLRSPQEFDKDMQSNYLNAIAWCYDPHSNYMNLNAKEEFNADVSAMEYSAGFTFDEDDKGNKNIDFLQPGGSAWRSGQLHKGDLITKVKINDTEKDVRDLSAAELNAFINSAGTESIEITVRTSAGEIKTVKLAEEKITNEEGIVKSYVLKNDKNIGYINLPGFYSREEDEKEPSYNGCANDVSKEIIKLKRDNISGLILDLRNNGGGSMWEAIQLAGIFIDIGPVASVKGKDGKVLFMKDPNRGTIYDGPMIVLTNGASASASEFLSATLQDYNRALIVGGTTYGKGTAQSVQPLDTLKSDVNKMYEDFVKVTERKFYRVNGTTVQWKGVEPDIMLPDIYSNTSYKEKAQASALSPDLSKAGNYTALPTFAVSDLREKSAERIKTNPYFRLIEKFNLLTAGGKSYSIPLQWKSFAQYNKRTSEIFAEFKGIKTDSTKVNADNNSFDKERISMSDQRTKEINDTYLKDISFDKEIAEVCKIFTDWLRR